ncbi:hypothetical protein B0T14DRAFT_512962 [Immersiella caudata]|uniref:Uncharacterized protein n=1 Tax=Immersiella caudata TaxID=314043 RepID=A0AA40C809_9PEZI|nr:hypothetical protein B0T14DRAFT_512962 [Immersiella caudata]
MESLPTLRDAFLRSHEFQLEGEVDALLDTVHIHMVDAFGKCNSRATATSVSDSKRRKMSQPKSALASRKASTPANPSLEAPALGIPRALEPQPSLYPACANIPEGSSNVSPIPSLCGREGGACGSPSSAFESRTDYLSLPTTIPSIDDDELYLFQLAGSKGLVDDVLCPDPAIRTSTAEREILASSLSIGANGSGTRLPSSSLSYEQDRDLRWRQPEEIHDQGCAPQDMLAFGFMFPLDPKSSSKITTECFNSMLDLDKDFEL